MHEATSTSGSFVTDVVAPLKKLLLTLSPIQSGSGDPSPDNVRPISGHTEVVTEVVGKNLYSDVFSEYTKPAQYYLKLLNLRVGDTISASVTLKGTAVSGCVVGIVSGGDSYPFASQRNFIGTNGQILNQGAFTLTDSWTDPKLAIYCSGEEQFNQLFENYEIQLELGTTATAYEPYQGNTYTTPLERTVYGGTLDVVSGELVVDRAMVDLGTREWSRYDPSGTNIPVFYASVPNAKIATIPICSAYKCESWSSLSSRTNGTLQMHPTLVLAYVADDRFTDATDFKTAVSGVQLCYELATPQTYQLTSQQINSLIGQNNIITEDGVEVSEVVYMTRLVGSPLLGSPQTEAPTEETDEPIEEPEGE